MDNQTTDWNSIQEGLSAVGYQASEEWKIDNWTTKNLGEDSDRHKE